MKKATVSLSMEIELGWGMDTPEKLRNRLSDGRKRETQYLEEILTVCDNLGIPFTFAVVGHLLLDECDGTHGRYGRIGPFGNDPGTEVRQDPNFYAPDLVEKIRDAKVQHEIGTHTFSHINCLDEDDERIRWEFDQVRKIYEKEGLSPPVSFVAPWHQYCSELILEEFDIKVIRQSASDVKPCNPETLWWIFLRNHPIRSAERTKKGILKTYSTSFESLVSPLLKSDPVPQFKFIPKRIRKYIHFKFLKGTVERAIEKGSHLHHWTHLWNISNTAHLEVILRFLRFLSKCEQKGRIKFLTMNQLEDESS